MTALPVARYLRELGGEGRRGGKGSEFASGGSAQSEIERRIEEAYTRGVLEGRAAAQAEYDVVLKEQSETAEFKHAAERRRWAEEQGDRLGALLLGAARDLELRVADQLARVLKPFVSESVKQRAVAELVVVLDELLLKGDVRKFTVSGPPDLLDALKAKLADHSGVITFVADERVADLAVVADETIIETRIGAWMRTIAEEAP